MQEIAEVAGAQAPREPSSPATASRLMVLLFSDIVGSTELKNRLGTVEYAAALARHDRLFREIVQSTPGATILKDTGDGFFASFATASDAVRAALRFQFGLSRLEAPLKTRIGLHVGEVAELDRQSDGMPKVVGLAADFAARVMNLAAGGQILLTQFAFNEARQFVLAHPPTDGQPPPLIWVAHGDYVFKGSDQPIEVFEVGAQGLAPLVPPPDSPEARRCVRPGDELTLGWRPAVGLELLGRPNWIIKQKLGEGGFGEVWLARHTKTGHMRVFKFCFEPERLRGLKREVVLFRLLKDALGDRRDIGRVIDYQFEESPYFIESEHVPAGNLLTWAQTQGGIDQMPLEMRLRIVAEVADALSAAHSVGVLHKDIKPSNILIAADADGRPYPVLTDFGIGILTDRTQLQKRDITMAGFTQSQITANESSRTGTRIYAPPESLLERPFTVQGDVYALGVVLYQMAAGDLARPLAEGWERDLAADELLCEDISACVQGDPQRRLGSAAELSTRLRSRPARLEQRSVQRKALAAAARRKRLVRIMCVLLVVAGGLAAALGAALRERSGRLAAETRARAEAEAARDHIQRERDRAVAVQDFLREMLASPSPEQNSDKDLKVRDMLDRAARKIEAPGAISQPQVEAVVRGAIGRSFLVLGLYPQAEPQLKRAVELGRKVAPYDLLTNKAMSDLAVLYLYTADFAAAEQAFKEVLDQRLKTLGLENRDTADALFNLSLACSRQRKFDAARDYGRRALAVREKLFGAESAPVAASLQYLGLAENDAGNYAAAEPLCLRSLQLRQKLLPANHFEIGNSHANLGLIYMNESKLDPAEQEFKAALQVFEKSLDPEHPNVAMVLNNLAAVHLRRKDYDGAKPYADRALEIQEKRLGPDHPDLALALNASAGVCEGQGDYPAAEALYGRALGIVEKALGPEHPYALSFRLNLAILDGKQGRYDQAIAALQALVPAMQKIGALDGVFQCHVGTAEAMIQQKRFADAEPEALAALEVAGQVPAAEMRAEFTATAHQLLAVLYDGWEKPERAARYRSAESATTRPATRP